MNSLRAGRTAGVAVFAGALFVGGCLYVPGATTGEPGVGRTRLGVGLTGGWTIPFDKDLDADSYVAGQVSYWFTGLVAGRIWFGGTSLDDSSTTTPGTLKVAPIAVSAMLSLPTSEAAKDAPFRWSIGFGAGLLTFRHTGASNPSALPVLTLHGGGEWILAQGGGRLFAMGDLTMGDVVKIGGVERDLKNMLTVRAGLEISF